jgi:hypothetical protein
MATQLVVTGPVVVLPDATEGKIAYYYRGAVLPEGLNEDRVADVVGLGLVAEVEVDAAAVEQGDTADPNAVPDGTADEVLAWVGDDPARAARALVAEKIAEKPRTTLLDKLAKLTEQQA